MKKLLILLTVLSSNLLTFEAQGIVGGEVIQDLDDRITLSTVALTTRGRSFCTGTLIEDRYVITAAHCVQSGRRFSISFGTQVGEDTVSVNVARVTSHQNYRGARNGFDIALVELEQPAPAGFEPVPLLPAGVALRPGTPLILAGFGLTHPNDLFGQGTGTLRQVGVRLNTLLPERGELIFGPDITRSACKGDSGGPAYVEDIEGNLYLLGATSRGNPNVRNQWGGTGCSGTGFYTNVTQYEAWIEANK